MNAFIPPRAVDPLREENEKLRLRVTDLERAVRLALDEDQELVLRGVTCLSGTVVHQLRLAIGEVSP